MSGETAPIAEMANKVSKELFEWFRWERVPLMDQNFECVKKDKHAPKKKQDHTHPVDVVFHYIDPYLNRRILLNTDLKSYSKGSISAGSVRSALRSLAQTIDCARVSPVWKQRYEITADLCEVRGMLFVYNHDAEYDGDFMAILEERKPKKGREADAEGEKTVTTETLPLEAPQIIHVVEPRLIAYMTTVIGDAQRLHAEGTFPREQYYFHYPDLKLHKTYGSRESRAATIEMLAGPFLIIEHDVVKTLAEASQTVVDSFPAGFLIYYNRPGESHNEFMYLFDTLSNYQILDGKHPIRIRVAHHAPHRDVRSNFERAIEMYIADWGFDKYKQDRLKDISLELVEVRKTTFSRTDIKWDREKK
jgi:hypothetical protein